MSFFLAHGAVGSGSSLIKAHERAEFTDALGLLTAAQQQATEIDARAQEASQRAEEQGLARGLANAEESIASEIAKLTDAVATIRAEYEASVAEAAYAAVTAIVGTLDDAEIVNRIVTNQLATRNESSGLRINVAPQMASGLQERIAAHEGCEIVADPDLAPTACRLTTGDGRIVADLSLQLETLRQRWGLEAAKEGLGA
jgi:flagellar biosynthesis/type III secretory pathway protein FliH